MSTFKEKLSILSEMISFARVDDYLKPAELDFLESVANNLGIDTETFVSLLEHKAEKKVLKTEGERLVQFHRLVLLMNIDKSVSLPELNKLHEIGVKMGLSPSSIDRVLEIMNRYPDKIIPVDQFIAIFKTQYN